MHTLLQDLRYGARALLRSPGFTLVAVLTLALGIGANTTVFSLTNAIFLRPIPRVGEPAELVRVFSSESDEPPGRRFGPLSYPDFQDLRALRVFDGAAVFGRADVTLGSGDRAEAVDAQLVGGGYFGVLRVRPALGRGFLLAEEEASGGAAVAVLSHDYWQARLGSDPGVVGRTILVNGHPFTVVGVAPEKFSGSEIEHAPALWVPISQAAVLKPGAKGLLDRGTRWLRMVARLHPGVSRERAQTAVDVAARRLSAGYADTNRKRVFPLVPGGTFVVPSQAPQVAIVFTMVSVVVGLVLLIACANVANLLLARATQRRREIALRLSLGAGRGRIVRQLLTEGLFLAVVGGAAGLALTGLGTRLLDLLQLPSSLDFSLDVRVLAYTAAVSLLTPLLFGLAPALQATRPDLVASLKEGTSGAGQGRSRLRGGLVVSQIAISLVMLIAAGLLLRTLHAMRTADTGYDADRVLAAPLNPRTRGYEGERTQQLVAALLERVRALAGVESATASTMVPLNGRQYGTEVTFPESEPMRGRTIPLTYNSVEPDYFRTLGIRVAQGRGITGQDRPGTPPVAVVNEAAARRFWPGSSAVGKHIRSGGEDGKVYEVVGVARDARFTGLAGEEIPMMYVAFAQAPELGEVTIQIRASGRPEGIAAALRREVRALDPDLPLGPVSTLRELAYEQMIGPRLTATLLGVFGALALLLASVGLSGVVAYTVTQRTRELGVRMALGAAAQDVVGLVVGQGMRLVGIGVAVGGVLSVLASRLIASQLYAVGPNDPVTFLGVAALLGTVALLASYLPARRATRVDPMIALRAE